MATGKRQRQRERRMAQEAAAVATEVRTDLTDLNEATVRSDGTFEVLLINPGWGSTGFYSAEVLEAAGAARIFARGTQMFLDHPGANEKIDRPERSVRDLAAVLETDGAWQPNGSKGPGIYAQAKPLDGWQPVIKAIAPHTGVSIRASAEVSSGEAEGRRGRIVERLVEAVSVDFVTRAGRGGQIVSALEAAGRTDLAELVEARNVGEWFQSRIHLDFTTRADEMFGDGRLTRDERVVLSKGIGAALDAFSQTIEELAPQLLARDLWADPAATTTTTESHQEDAVPLTEEIKEAVAAAVKAEVAPIQTELDETKTKLADTEAELAESKKTTTAATEALRIKQATDHVAANQAVKALPAIARQNLVTAVAHEATLDDKGTLDTAKLDEAITTAVAAKVAELAEAGGSPVTGAGGGDITASEATKEASEASLSELFTELGLSTEAAKTAVAGW